jgi:hypothetical protein
MSIDKGFVYKLFQDIENIFMMVAGLYSLQKFNRNTETSESSFIKFFQGNR